MSLNRLRYPFWKVFWVVVGIQIILQMFSLGVLAVVEVPDKSYSLQDALTWWSLTQTIVATMFNVIFYYFTLNKFHKLFYEKQLWTVFAVYILKVSFWCLLYYIFSNVIFEANLKKLQQYNTLGLKIFSYVFVTLFIIGLSLLLAYLNHLRDQSKQRKILERQKIKLEVEKLQADYQFLKAQINPHFLHNTLNFFYAKSLPYSAELSEGILTLSEIMRYALAKPETPDGKVLLTHEIDHLRNVIKINQLRFNNKLNVQMQVNGIINEITIIPFVLITIVENAFKHGDLKNESHPIEISLTVNESGLTFSCKNKKKSGPKELSTGIGLDNTQKRLEMAYGKNYQLTIQDETDFYTTLLNITAL